MSALIAAPTAQLTDIGACPETTSLTETFVGLETGGEPNNSLILLRPDDISVAFSPPPKLCSTGSPASEDIENRRSFALPEIQFPHPPRRKQRFRAESNASAPKATLYIVVVILLVGFLAWYFNIFGAGRGFMFIPPSAAFKKSLVGQMVSRDNGQVYFVTEDTLYWVSPSCKGAHASPSVTGLPSGTFKGLKGGGDIRTSPYKYLCT
jgi:hypothetical protein